MACQKRERTGSCGHHQCDYSEHTEHGYECVDILYHDNVPFCEVGQGCYSKCPFAFQKGDGSKTEQAHDEWVKKELEDM